MQIEALIEYVALFRQGDSTIEARKGLLREQRSLLIRRMEDMQKSLDRLNQKIDPVSYTHLDVYKRQSLNRSSWEPVPFCFLEKRISICSIARWLKKVNENNFKRKLILFCSLLY